MVFFFDCQRQTDHPWVRYREGKMKKLVTFWVDLSNRAKPIKTESEKLFFFCKDDSFFPTFIFFFFFNFFFVFVYSLLVLFIYFMRNESTNYLRHWSTSWQEKPCGDFWSTTITTIIQHSIYSCCEETQIELIILHTNVIRGFLSFFNSCLSAGSSCPQQ